MKVVLKSARKGTKVTKNTRDSSQAAKELTKGRLAKNNMAGGLISED